MNRHTSTISWLIDCIVCRSPLVKLARRLGEATLGESRMLSRNEYTLVSLPHISHLDDTTTAHDYRHRLTVLLARQDKNLLLILVLPLLLVALDTSWLFHALQGYIDPWIYFGYFLDLKQHLKAFAGSYYGTRLSWILPGFLVYRLFSVGSAIYVLHVGMCYVAVISLYLILKRTVSHRAALLAAILMCFHSYFLFAIGWDYFDAPGITYFLLGLLALTYAATSKRWCLRIILGGVFCAGMIYSNLFLVTFAPLMALYYLALNHQHRKHSALGSLAGFAVGFFGMTSLLGGLNYALQEEFWFFVPSVDVARGLITRGNPWRLASVVPEYYFGILIPALTFVNSIVFLLMRRFVEPIQRRGSSLLFQFVYVLNVSTMILWELLGQPVLEYVYYISLLLPMMFLALGSQLAAVTERMTERQFALISSLTLLVVLMVYISPIGSTIASWPRPQKVFVIVAVVSLLNVSGLVVLLARPRKCLIVAPVLIAAAFFTLNAVTNGWTNQPESVKDQFIAVARSVETVKAMDPAVESLFWYNANEPSLGNLYRAVSSAYLWSYRLYNEEFPAVQRHTQNLSIYRKVIVLSNRSDAVPQAERALSQMGYSPRVRGQRVIQQGAIVYKMVFLEVGEAEVEVTGDGWPKTLSLLEGGRKGTEHHLSGPTVREMLRSDMDSVSEWEINRYGRSGGVEISAEGLRSSERGLRFSSGTQRDHLASRFVKLPMPTSGLVFFSIWAKAERKELPVVSLQNESFTVLARARPIVSRGDGWRLLAGWTQRPNDGKVRLVVQQQSGAVSVLDKVYVVEVP